MARLTGSILPTSTYSGSTADLYERIGISPGGLGTRVPGWKDAFTFSPYQSPGPAATSASLPSPGGSLPMFQAPQISASQAAPPPLPARALPMQPARPSFAIPSPFLPQGRTNLPRLNLGGGLALPGTGISGFGGPPSFAAPIFSSASSTPFWNALLAYRSPAMQSQMGGSYSNPFATSYFPNYYPDAYMGDPLFRMRWTSRGQLPLWMRNYSQEP